jgi:hypothetical protein
MMEWLSTYNETLGMHHVSIFTTIFGSFCVAFTVIICWEKLVQDFGPAGGMLAAAIIVGTFWVMNHKLPGFGIHPEMLQTADGDTMQFGLIHQGARAAAPWIDMGWAIGMGLWVCSLLDLPKGQRGMLAVESAPRVLAVCVGGIIGGAIVGLIGYTGAELFGWTEMTTQFPAP